jgi:hypothetical protein
MTPPHSRIALQEEGFKIDTIDPRSLVRFSNDLRYSLNRLDDLNCTIEELIASYPDLVGTYWKGSLTLKVSSSDSDTHPNLRKID